MPDPLDGLDRAQRAAVTHPGGPLLVVGGAGTGKTRVLARRFAWLVEQGTPARRGARADASPAPRPPSCASALEALIDAPVRGAAVATFRALLRAAAARRGARGRPRPVLRARHAGRPAGAAARPHRRAARCATTRSAATRRRCSAELRLAHRPAEGGDGHRARTTRATRERAGGARRTTTRRAPTPSASSSSRGLYADHDRLLADARRARLRRPVLRAFRLLHEQPARARARWRARFPHVLVDEYQDASFAQGMLLRLLVQERGERDGRRRRRPGDPPLPRRGAARTCDDFEREYPDARSCGSSAATAAGRGSSTAARRGGRSRSPDRIEKTAAAARGGGERALLALPLRARAGAGGGGRGRAAGARRGRRARARSACSCARSQTRAPVVGAALEERAMPFRLDRRGRVLPARRGARRARLAARCWPTRATRARSCARCRGRRSSCARSTSRASPSSRGGASSTWSSAIAAALEGPQLSPEGRDRAQAFLRLYRAARRARSRRCAPDAFVHRLIERIGLRRQQVFAAQADTVERLRQHRQARPSWPRAYMRREPQATPRDFARYIAAVAEAGLPEEEAEPAGAPRRRAGDDDATPPRGSSSTTSSCSGSSAARMPGPARARRRDAVPDELLQGGAAATTTARRTRARCAGCCTWR